MTTIKEITGVWVSKCCVCGTHYLNGCGSTPCCGSVQEIVCGENNEDDLRNKLTASEAGAAALREALQHTVDLCESCQAPGYVVRAKAALATDAGEATLRELQALREFKIKATEWNKLCELEMKNLRTLNEGLEEELKLSKQESLAIRHSVVETIGGVDHEGNPTSRINYLQRLRILVAAEKERDDAREQAKTLGAEIVRINRLAAKDCDDARAKLAESDMQNAQFITEIREKLAKAVRERDEARTANSELSQRFQESIQDADKWCKLANERYTELTAARALADRLGEELENIVLVGQLKYPTVDGPRIKAAIAAWKEAK